MKYAIIRLAGKQYKVEEGSILVVDKTKDEKPQPEVLMSAKEGKYEIGTPVVKGVKIILKKLNDEKGDKIHVKKYKAKSRYRRKIGFRPQLTRFVIEKII